MGKLDGMVALVTGEWYLEQIYRYLYFPLAGSIWLLGAFGWLPRVKPSTRGEGHERRFFYGTVWAVSLAQPMLGLLWLTLPRAWGLDLLKRDQAPGGSRTPGGRVSHAYLACACAAGASALFRSSTDSSCQVPHDLRTSSWLSRPSSGMVATPY